MEGATPSLPRSPTSRAVGGASGVLAWARRWLPELALGAFLLLEVLPVLLHLGRRIISPLDGPHGDVVAHAWQHWWFGRFVAGESPLFTSRFTTFPAEVQLSSLWEGHLDLLFSLPLISLLGPVVTTNLVTVAFVVLAAVGAYLLARELTGDRGAAAAAAMLYALSPTLVREVAQGRHEMAATGLLGVALVYFGRYFSGGPVRTLVWAMLALVLAVLGYLVLAPITVLLLPLLGGGYLLVRRGRVPPRRLALVAAALGALAVGALAYAWVAIGGSWSLAGLGGGFSRPEYQTWLEVSRLSALPPAELLSPLPWGEPRCLGLIALMIGGLTLLAPGRLRATLPWWLGALCFSLLALGPLQAQVGGVQLVSPYIYLPRVVPFWMRFHWPFRLLLVGDLCLAALAAMGLAALRAHLPRGGWARTAALALPVALAAAQVGRLFPLRAVVWPSLPAAYDVLREEPTGGLLEIAASADPERPLGDVSWNRWLVDPQIAQMAHGRPFCCLALPPGLQPAGLVEAFQGDPWLDYLAGHGLPPAGGEGDLARQGFSHVVLQGRYLEPAEPSHSQHPHLPPEPIERRHRALRDALLQRYGEPIASSPVRDGVVEIFRVPAAGADAVLPGYRMAPVPASKD